MAASTDAFITRLCDPWPAASVTGLQFKLAVELTPGDLAPGEYKAEVRLKVPAAFYPDVKVPILLTVVEPPVE